MAWRIKSAIREKRGSKTLYNRRMWYWSAALSFISTTVLATREVRCVRRLLISLLLIIFTLYFTPLDLVIPVSAEVAGACRELFFTYVNKDGSIDVFKTN